jgi:hypothetical protein
MTRGRLIAAFLVLGAGAIAVVLATRPAHPGAPRVTPRGELIASRTGPSPDDAFRRKLLDRSTLQKRDEFVTPDGAHFTIYQGRTEDGAKVCVASAGRGALGSACDAPGFAISPVIWVESGSAGPGGTPVTEWDLSGLAAPSVARLELVDSTGRHRPVHLGRGNAFFVALSHGELKHGVSAVSLDVYSADGSLLASIAL